MARSKIRLHADDSPSPSAPFAFAVDTTALRPLVQIIVAEVLAQVEHNQATLPKDLCFSEPEAAALLKVEPWVLRDERQRGKIVASKIVGRRIRYTRDDLVAYLAGRRAG